MQNDDLQASELQDALAQTGFVRCEFEPSEHDTCDRCKKPSQQLYFGNRSYWDSREGDYWCEGCVIAEARIAQEFDDHNWE